MKSGEKSSKSFRKNHVISLFANHSYRTHVVNSTPCEGALEGLTAALKLPSNRFAEDLWICLDNLEVAMQLLAPSKGSSQGVFQKFTELAPIWQTRNKLPHIPPGRVRIRWVPGHTKIKGNEAADKAAKEGAKQHLPEGQEEVFSLASLKRWAKQTAPQALNGLWQTVAPQSYRDLGIHFSSPNPKELQFQRPFLGRIIAARSGYGDFADYHERFKHNDALILCSCGARKAPLHLFFCTRGKRRARIPSSTKMPAAAIDELLGTIEGVDRLIGWIKKTNFFIDICPMKPVS